MYSIDRSGSLPLPFSITVNGNEIKYLVIGRHYREHHAHSINDLVILNLVQSLDGKTFKPDSIQKRSWHNQNLSSYLVI